MHTNTKKRRKKARAGKIILGLMVAAMIVSYFALTYSADKLYTITDGDTTLSISSDASDMETVLTEAGISMKEGDQYTVSGGSQKAHVVIHRSQNVTVNHGDETISASTFGTTVGALLEELNISLKEGDTVTSEGQPLSIARETFDGMTIDIGSILTETRSELVEIPFETITYMDPTLEEGVTEIDTPGVAGQTQMIYEDTYVNGSLSASTLSQTKVLEEPVTEVVLVGCKAAPTEEEIAVEIYVEPEPEPEPEPSYTPAPSYTPEPEYYEPEYYEPEPEYTAPSYSGNTITTASGEVISYSYSLSVTATAYTGGGITATGTNARYGAIAVDPSVIPYGTRMYIVSDDGKYIYGYATAEDCGGAIKGNKIDLYFDSYDTCIQFGRRSCTVYILP